jgi:hypothetical protein
VITSAAVDLLDRAVDAWELYTGDDPPAGARVVVGGPAYDECCPALLVLTLDAFVFFDPFPLEQAGQNPGFGGATGARPRVCGGTLGALATLHVGICVPVLDDRGRAPEPAAEQAAHLQLVGLVDAIARALTCDGDERWLVGMTALGLAPEGGCLVAQMALRIDGGE